MRAPRPWILKSAAWLFKTSAARQAREEAVRLHEQSAPDDSAQILGAFRPRPRSGCIDVQVSRAGRSRRSRTSSRSSIGGVVVNAPPTAQRGRDITAETCAPCTKSGRRERAAAEIVSRKLVPPPLPFAMPPRTHARAAHLALAKRARQPSLPGPFVPGLAQAAVHHFVSPPGYRPHSKRRPYQGYIISMADTLR